MQTQKVPVAVATQAEKSGENRRILLFFILFASLLHENAERIQHFDIIFEEDLSQAFWIIFRIENRMIFVAFRPKICFASMT